MSREGSLQEVIVAGFEHNMSSIYTAIPAVVLTIRNNLSELSVDVQPAVNQLNRDGTSSEYPPVLNIPVVMPASKSSAFLFPLAVGDTVLLIFSMRGMDTFKRGNGKPSSPSDLRRFDSRDAVAIPGLFPFGSSVNNPAKHVWQHSPTDTVVVHNLGSGNETEIRLKAGGGVVINTFQDVEVNCANAQITATESVGINTPLMNVDATTTNWIGDIVQTGVLSSNTVTLSGHKHSGGPSPDPGT